MHGNYCRAWGRPRGSVADLTSLADLLRQQTHRASDRTSFADFYFIQLLQTPSLSHLFSSVLRSHGARDSCAHPREPCSLDHGIRPTCDRTSPIPTHATTLRRTRAITISMRTAERLASSFYPDNTFSA